MANNLAITRSVVDGTIFTQAQNNTQMTDIETFINTTKLTGENIQNASITSTQLGTGSVTNTQLAAGAVGTAAIAANAITAACLNTNTVDSAQIALNGDNKISIIAGSIGTPQLTDGAVTQAKRTALGQQVSSSCGNFTTTSGSYVDITNLSVTITTSGRPVYIVLVSDGSGNASFIGAQRVGSGTSEGHIKLFRDSTEIAHQEILVSASGASSSSTICPSSSIQQLDVVTAGTYTYKLQGLIVSGTLFTQYSKLAAFEL